MTKKKHLSFWQIWNMSFGFLGMQFGWGLQMGNMSAIYEYLGANAHELPILWLAAPLTGLLVQPIIGYMSDRTWGPLGRRRPYFLTGALLSSAALLLMPNSSSLWMAAGLLWVMDSSINISMEPFRAFVADLLPEDQRTRGFAMQSLFIGLGDVLGFAMPWVLRHLGVMNKVGAAKNAIPETVRLSFQIGAAAFIGAVLWTVFTTKEYPPEDLESFRQNNAKKEGLFHGASEILQAIRDMPQTMRQLAWVQIFTWLGLFCMWLYFVPVVARNIFNAPNELSPLYSLGVEWGGICFAGYSMVCFIFSLMLPTVARKLGRKVTHSLCLTAGAIGLLSVGFVHSQYLLLVSMVGVGVAWASILSMPYAILAGALPTEKTGVYMGVFNFFIVIPEICTALGFGWIMKHFLHDDRLLAVMGGGVFMLLAAALVYRVHEPVTVEAGGTPHAEPQESSHPPPTTQASANLA